MIPSNDSKLWPIIGMIIVGIIFTVNSRVLYANGWSNGDTINVVTLMMGVGGVSAARLIGNK